MHIENENSDIGNTFSQKMKILKILKISENYINFPCTKLYVWMGGPDVRLEGGPDVHVERENSDTELYA